MLTIKNEKLFTITDELKRELTKIYQDQLSKLILFGSQARGDANPYSDIDILVVLKDEINPVEEINRNSYLISEMCLKYDVLINCFYITESNLNNDNKLLIKNIKKDGILL
jgi:uncharacterized protein